MMPTIPHETTIRITTTVKGNLYYPQMHKIMYLTTPLRKESNAPLHKRTLLALDNETENIILKEPTTLLDDWNADHFV